MANGSPSNQTRDRRSVSPTMFRRLALAALLSLIVVTVAGAVVRLTGSGLGCETWPSCESDSLVPRSESGIQGMIEFVNRLIGMAVGLVAIVAVVAAHRRSPRRGDLINWAWQLLAWVVLNGLVGAVVVETELLPATVILHFGLAMIAVWSAVVLHYRAGLADPPSVPTEPAPGRQPSTAHPKLRTAANVLLASALLTISLGTLVTGAGPHAGDDAADRLGLDVGTVAQLHGASAVALLAITVAVSTLARRERAAEPVMDRLRWLTLALLLQGAIGYTQYFTGVPPVLVTAHVVGAALVWVAALELWLSVWRPTLAATPEPQTTGAAGETAGQGDMAKTDH